MAGDDAGPIEDIAMASTPLPARGTSWFSLVLGIVIALIGLVLAAGGAWLAILGGSLYYLIAGIGLILSGLLLARGRPAGAWLYILVFVGTFLWALWEVGLDGWGLVPRLVGPFVLLLLSVLGLVLNGIVIGIRKRVLFWDASQKFNEEAAGKKAA